MKKSKEGSKKMNKKSFKYKWLLILLLMMGSSGMIDAAKKTIFTDTSTDVEVLDSFSDTSLYGKVVGTVPTDWDRPFIIYITALKQLKINTPYEIDTIHNKAQKIVEIKHGDKESFFIVSLLDNTVKGDVNNIHVMFKNGKSLLLNFHVLKKEYAKKANQDITFIDAVTNISNLKKFSKAHFDAETGRLNSVLEKKDLYLREMLNNTVKRFEVGETIKQDYGATSITLKNITVIGDMVLCHIEMTGKPYPLRNDNIVLELQNYIDIVVTEKKTHKQSEYPFDIEKYSTNTADNQEFTLYFKLQELKDTFYFTLKIGMEFTFTNDGRNRVVLGKNELCTDWMEDF
jgi:hypothetical protein